ncbi:dTDP-glucose 4,6-dehydratase [Methylacidiphilales bacterium]|nr:dTDP-glucose 4,6-dehydratase [Candidatus Methylacidiphilales bacterium]
METKNMNLLITGGAGFIGSNLVHELLRKDHPEPPQKIIVLDALTYSGNRENLAGLESDPRFEFVPGNILDQRLVAQLLIHHQIGGVMHLAAETHVDRSIDGPEPFLQTNVIGTLHLLESARKYFAQLEDSARDAFRFLHVSTDEVFGSLALADPPFSETTAYDPRSPYSASKAGSDHLVRAYGHTYGLPILVTNCSNNYGPRQFPEKLIPLMILNALEGKPLPVYGDGQQRRDWLYVRDHAQALELVMRRGRLGETYTIGGESEKTNLELLHRLTDLLNQHAPRQDGQSHRVGIQHVEDRPGHDRRYSISIEKIRSELGWKPSENLASGLEKTVLWYLQNKSWCEAITTRQYDRVRLGLKTS